MSIRNNYTGGEGGEEEFDLNYSESGSEDGDIHYSSDESHGVDTADEEERWHQHLRENVFVFPRDYLLWNYNYDSYLNQIELAYREWVNVYVDGPSLIVPQYPDEDTRSVNSMDELDYILNDQGRSMVYRYSHRHNQHLGWVMIKPIHLYSRDQFHQPCTSVDCVLCREMIDRFINFRSGHYDYLLSQLDGRYDNIPSIIENPFQFILAAPLPPWVDDNEPVPDLIVNVDNTVDNWDQDVIPQSVYFRPMNMMFREGECVICFESITEEQMSSVLPCGHTYHMRCLGEWDMVTSTCPLCREPYDMLGAEGLSASMQVEYTAVMELGSVEYDDPVPYYNLQHRDGKYQLYIFSGDLLAEQRLTFSGDILQVKDLKNDFSLQYNTKMFTHGTVGPYELEIIATSQVAAMLVEDDMGGEPIIDPVPYVAGSDNCQDRSILLITIGTYGDVRPYQLLQQEYCSLGYKCKLVGPTNTLSNYEFDYAALEHLYRSTAQSFPGIKALMQIPAVRRMADVMRIAIENEKPDLIITSPVMPGIRYLAAQYGIPYVTVSSIPVGEGAFTYMDQSTPWGKWFAQVFEAVVSTLTEVVVTVDDFIHSAGNCRLPSVDPVHRFFTIAPELYAEGCGNIILNSPTTQVFDFDIFFSMGSMIQVAVEEKYIALLRNMKSRVLFQTNRHTGTNGNITFIGTCNHEDVFRQVPLVICHGGSGTLQTALRYGCRVLVHPCWADQRYWPPVATQQGFDVEFLDTSTVLASRQIWKKFTLGRANYRMTGITPRSLAIRILGSTQKQETPIGTFLFSSDITELRTPQRAERLVFGSTRCEHVGIGHRSIDGLVRYVELWYDGTTVGVMESVSQEISPHITAVKFIDAPYDPGTFYTFVPTGYTLFTNCRTAVDHYLKHYGVDYTLTDWNVEKRNQVASRFLGTPPVKVSRVVASTCEDNPLGSTFMDIPHEIYRAPQDGDCLFHCVAKAQGISVEEQKRRLLPVLNDYLQELGLPEVKSVPYYTTGVGDLIPVALADSLDLRLAIFVNNNFVTVVNDEGLVTIYLTLTQWDVGSHYDLVQHTVINKVPDTCVNLEATGFVVQKTITPAPRLVKEWVMGELPESHKYALRAYLATFITDNNLGTPVQLPGGVRDYVARCGDSVIKVTAQTINTYHTSVATVDVEGIVYRIYTMPYWYDDGLPVANRTIRWPRAVIGTVPFEVSDDHRGNYRSLGGFAVPVDQYIGSIRSPTRGPPTLHLYT